MTKVMLVDDQKLFLEGLAMLRQERPDIAIVARTNSGTEAIEMALHNKPDLILIEVFLAGLNGIEAVRSIRATLKEPSIRERAFRRPALSRC